MTANSNVGARIRYKPMFADPVGPKRRWFAWRPVRLFDGTLVWRRWVVRVRFQSKSWLDGPLLSFWVYYLEEDIDADSV